MFDVDVGVDSTENGESRNSHISILDAFQGRVSSALKNIPVFGVLVDDLGERGAHYIAARELMKK